MILTILIFALLVTSFFFCFLLAMCRVGSDSAPSAPPPAIAPAPNPYPALPEYLIQCAWCKKYQCGDLWTLTPPHTHLPTSHGICADCAVQLLRDAGLGAINIPTRNSQISNPEI